MTPGAVNPDVPCAPAVGTRPRLVSLLLALAAAAAFEAARAALIPRPAWIAGDWALSLAGLGLLALYVWRQPREAGDSLRTIPATAKWPVLLACLTPVAYEVASRIGFEVGQASELFALACLRNIALAAALLSGWREARWAGATLSLFLVVFAFTLYDGAGMWVCGGLFALAGVWWLMDAYWEGISGRLAAEETRMQVPPTAVAVVLGAVAVVATGAMFLTRSASVTTTAISGWFPTSGGTGAHDPFAREGVNDGDQLVAARKEADTIGPLESELFLPGHEQSLYDVIMETAGEPTKTKTQKAVALTQLGPTKDEHFAQMQRAGREFSAIRRGAAPRPGEKRGDRRSEALLLVKGRAPLHLRLDAFALFDGRSWVAGEKKVGKVRPRIVERSGEPWLDVPWRGLRPFFAGHELHIVRTVHLKTNRVPSPDQLRGVHIKQVERADFFEFTHDGLLKMTRESIPPLTSIHVLSEVVDPRLLASSDFHLLAQGEHEEYLATPKTSRSGELAALAREWTRGLPRGWPQIEAILQRLRGGFVLDRQAVAPNDAEDAVAHFLLERRAGPSYLFASAAAILLRHAGYPTRFVSGLYVDPARYDSQADTTTVGKEDVHFWVEVLADRRTWVAVEPTPGYATLLPEPTWTELLAEMLDCTGRKALYYADWLAGGAAALGAAFLLRHALADAFLLGLAWLRSRSDLRGAARATVWLLELRGSLASTSRPAHLSPPRWFRQLALADAGERRSELLAFARVADWALYAPDTSPPPGDPGEALRLCHQIQRAWSSEVLARAAARSALSESSTPDLDSRLAPG